MVILNDRHLAWLIAATIVMVMGIIDLYLVTTHRFKVRDSGLTQSLVRDARSVVQLIRENKNILIEHQSALGFVRDNADLIDGDMNDAENIILYGKAANELSVALGVIPRQLLFQYGKDFINCPDPRTNVAEVFSSPDSRYGKNIVLSPFAVFGMKQPDTIREQAVVFLVLPSGLHGMTAEGELFSLSR